eukprot:CAMPEP_0170567186 /NCGR_PEP_ID=MMETSP0211-20121228/80321_1 /TAXON_ID=311385 /ORGANISM="Pseudokeronopsis sp., Strain OXSARD2" /LENGTH=357 /DNA_ID=CAMNT_0010888575 /DNA_START=782 /DNA_END=1855 /DNA_ORIENTATION=-
MELEHKYLQLKKQQTMEQIEFYNRKISTEPTEVKAKREISLREQKRPKHFIIYPDDIWKKRYDLYITLILLITCTYIPLRLAFDTTMAWETIQFYIFDNLVNLSFLVDIFVNLFSAYHNDDYVLVDNRKVIAMGYIKSWFFIDVLSIIPLSEFLDGLGYNRLIRLARVPKLYKLVKMSRLMRMFKILQDRNRLVKYLGEVLKIGIGFERLLFFMLLLMVIFHITACFWIMIANFTDSNDNWIYAGGYVDAGNGELYVTAFYYTVTTITTVGYGDISGHTVAEKLLCAILMLIGVSGFSFVAGSLSSLMTNLDSSQAQLKEKINILDTIRNDYLIDPDLYDDLRKAIKYDHQKNFKDI